MLARIRRRLAGDAGFSLPELLVAITILTIVSSALVTSVIVSQRSLGVANQTMTDLSASRNAIERIGALVRSATSADGELNNNDEYGVGDEMPLLYAGSDDLQFYSRTGIASQANPILIRFYVDTAGDNVGCSVDNPCLVEQQVQPNPLVGGIPTWPGAPSSRVIARDLQQTNVFAYWSHVQDADAGEPVGYRCGRRLDPGVGTLSDAEMIVTDSISFIVRLRGDSAYNNTPVELRGWARLANVEDIGYSSSAGEARCLDAIDGDYDYAA